MKLDNDNDGRTDGDVHSCYAIVYCSYLLLLPTRGPYTV